MKKISNAVKYSDLSHLLFALLASLTSCWFDQTTHVYGKVVDQNQQLVESIGRKNQLDLSQKSNNLNNARNGTPI